MTVILALKVKDKIYMAADSACASGWDVIHDANHKIFPRKIVAGDLYRTILIGGGGTSKACVMLQYPTLFLPPKHPVDEGMSDLEWMQSLFASEMQAVMNKNQISTVREGAFNGQSTFLIAYNHNLYEIGGDFHVALTGLPYCGTGSGSAYGVGYLDACHAQGVIEGISVLEGDELDSAAKRLLENAILCACRHNLGCRPPVSFLGPV